MISIVLYNKNTNKSNNNTIAHVRRYSISRIVVVSIGLLCFLMMMMMSRGTVVAFVFVPQQRSTHAILDVVVSSPTFYSVMKVSTKTTATTMHQPTRISTNARTIRTMGDKRISSRIPQLSVQLYMGLSQQQVSVVSEKDAQKGIDTVVKALRKDKVAIMELGTLEKVTVVVGYGTPSPGTLAVRFNASFRKTQQKGLSSIPLPFGLGQSKVSDGRGTMVGQVKASIDMKTGKVTNCSVFRDLGYGRAFNLKV